MSNLTKLFTLNATQGYDSTKRVVLATSRVAGLGALATLKVSYKGAVLAKEKSNELMDVMDKKANAMMDDLLAFQEKHGIK